MTNYGSLADANIFFTNRLFSWDWENSSVENRQKALIHATQLIDQFDYKCDKYAVTILDDPTQDEKEAAELSQPLQFPRGESNIVPTEIEHACYLIAQALLSGRDPNMDLEALSHTGVGYGNVRANYDRSTIMEHVTHLIPSPEAFNLLRPFFRLRNSFNTKRV